ncbi:MAG: M48 family metallopeptidase [Gammaproteobacteria bacterium]|nr:M48 family metallopeptidase [Gammaproteobacteria bacterium]
MNFFEHQDKARRNTGLLIVLFSMAVLILITLTNLLVIGFIIFTRMESGNAITMMELFEQSFNWGLFIQVGLLISAIILLASLYKIAVLSSGGKAIAEMLDANIVPQGTRDHNLKQLLNVVEEMAIASGTPVPNVYLLEENSINAFAAGTSPQNAIIGITRGALDNLNRDELQGVIGHEFSHILNGDMNINLKLVGVLNGILIIYLMGRFIIRSMHHTSSRNNKNNLPALFILGFGLIVIGGVGHFFGQWIKAIVSRQREYLADASSVQFTRNPQGIGNALKKIGGHTTGSILQTSSAVEYSHAFFAKGISHFFLSMFSTHPPLKKRILRVDPYWDGQYLKPKPKKKKQPETTKDDKSEQTNLINNTILAATVISEYDKHLKQATNSIVSQVGTLDKKNIIYAQHLISEIPVTLKAHTETGSNARLIIMALILQKKQLEDNQLSILENNLELDEKNTCITIYEQLTTLPLKLHLPIVELCMPSLTQLSINQYKNFKNTIEMLILADRKITLKEWFIKRLVLQHLDEHFALTKKPKEILFTIGSVKSEAESLLSLIAYIEHSDNVLAKDAFSSGLKLVGLTAFQFKPGKQFSLKEIDHSVDKIAQLKPLLKQRILKACAAIILHDHIATEQGLEVLRAVSSSINCPMPPITIN